MVAKQDDVVGGAHALGVDDGAVRVVLAEEEGDGAEAFVGSYCDVRAIGIENIIFVGEKEGDAELRDAVVVIGDALLLHFRGGGDL